MLPITLHFPYTSLQDVSALLKTLKYCAGLTEYKFQVRSEESTTVASVPGKCSPVLFLLLALLSFSASPLLSLDKVPKYPWSVVCYMCYCSQRKSTVFLLFFIL